MKKQEFNNPLLWMDYPDPDVIRVEDTYYMVSTTMHMMPGCPIMKSKDLVHWEMVSYLYDIIEDNAAYRLEDNQNVYSSGQWAASLRYHEGVYYVCFDCNDLKKTYIYYTSDIENGTWNRHVLEGIYHDSSLLFDEGHLYIIYNGGDIMITELETDGSGIKAGGVHQLLFKTPSDQIMLRCEGCHSYKIGEYYYLQFIEWPFHENKRRRQICYRSKTLLGEYERRIILDDDLGYQNNGVAQGAMVDTPEGDWYAILFQDHGAVGRIPILLPVIWEDDWPMMGVDGKVPFSLTLQQAEPTERSLYGSDSFDHPSNELEAYWQWNHNPEHGLWSFIERPGYLRLRTGQISGDELQARNTLTQRTKGPTCSMSVQLSTEGLQPGDHAGLIALQSNYAAIGVERYGTDCYLVCRKGIPEQETLTEIRTLLHSNRVHLKISFDFTDGIDIAEFYYSLDGNVWEKTGTPLRMRYTLDHFVGYRIGLYCYSTLHIGGYADYQNFQYEDTLL
ncbi:MAG: glycoside hydrolase family 43 [Firmicutes bacterium]|nr:glycoside hydrolase family 43 [Bacillota bacterium]